MKSLQDYSTNHLSGVDEIIQLVENISNLNTNIITESQFICEHGKSLDGIFNKMHAYTRNISSNVINESYKSSFDIKLSINEQKAAQDFFIRLGQTYAYSLLLEAGLIDNINKGIISSLKNAGSFVKQTVKGATEKAKEGYEFIKTKLKALWDFLSEIAKDGIKSIKKMILKIVDMMLAFACKVDDLMEKLKADKKQALAELMAKVKTLFKKKDKEVEQNVFETIANELLSNNNGLITENLINEHLEATNEDLISAEQFINEENEENEYDKAAKANPEIAPDVEGKSWGGILGKALMLVLIQALAYTVVCVVIPALVTLVAGPLAGAIAENLAKIIWGSGVIFHQIRAEFKLHESGEFDEKYNTKWKKAFHYLFFFLNLVWAAWKLIGAGMAMGKIINAWMDGNQKFLSTVLPSQAVQNCAGWMNDIWKKLSGTDAPGFAKMQDTVNALEKGIYEKISEEKTSKTIKTHDGKSTEELKNEFEKTNWNSSTEAANTMTRNAMSPEEISKLSDDARVTIEYNGVFAPGVNDWSNDCVTALVKAGYTKKEALEILSGQAYNAALNAQNVHAGAMGFCEIPGKALKILTKAGCKSANGHPIAGLGKDVYKTVTTTITKWAIQHTPSLQNTFDWFGGFIELPSFAQAKQTGNWFLLRMSSGNKGSKAIYDIKDVKEFTWDEAKSKFSELNPKVFNNMDNMIKGNAEKLKSVESQISNSDGADETNNEIGKKKTVKDVIKDKEKAAKITGKSKNCFVLYGTPYKNKDKDTKSNESLLDNLYDEFIYESKVDTRQRKAIKELLFTATQALREANKKYQDSNDEKLKEFILSYKKEYEDNYAKYVSGKTSDYLNWNSADDIKLSKEATHKKSQIIKTLTEFVENINKKYKDTIGDDAPGAKDAVDNAKNAVDASNDSDSSDNSSSESSDSSDELVPVVIFNPLVMGCGDLVAGRSKNDKNDGKRANVIYYKGMLSSFEILPKDGGFSRAEIRNWLIAILQNSFKVCLNISANPPCYKTLLGMGKWKISDAYKDNSTENIKEFGDFNAEECLDIANGSKDVEKFFGGLNKTTHNTVEKKDSENQKKEHEKHVKEITDDIKNNEKVKKVLDEHPNLKKKLLDDEGNVNAENVDAIADTITRVDNNLGKEKKGLFSKIGSKLKSIFGGKDDDDKLKDYDPKELQELSFALHSAKADRRKTKKKKQESNDENVSDSYIDNNELIIESYNQIQDYLFTEELYDYLINNNIQEDNNSEIKPKLGSLTAYAKSKLINR